MKRFFPHDARRTFISWLLDSGADLASVQRLVGHATLATTSKYDRRGEAAKRQAVDKLPFPYLPRRTAVWRRQASQASRYDRLDEGATSLNFTLPAMATSCTAG